MKQAKCSQEVSFICGDPGGASAAAPVIKQLSMNASVQVQVFAYLEAEVVFREHEIPFTGISVSITDNEIEVLLQIPKTNLLIVGTSFNQFELEKRFVAGASSLEITTLAILDYWANYAQRFSRQGADLLCLPDKIAIMDQLALEEMKAEGLPEDRLVITGQPAFDFLQNQRLWFSAEDKKIYRKKLGVEGDSFLVLFVSQPFSKLFGVDQSNPLYPGYDEQTAFADLLAGLEALSLQKWLAVNIVIQPHLREKDPWWENVETDFVQMVSPNEMSFPMLALSSDLVVGMTSTKLVEATLLGRPAISLQLGANQNQRFDMERLGILKDIFSKESLSAELESDTFLSFEAEKLPTRAIDTHATGRVTQLALQMLGIESIDVDRASVKSKLEVR